MTAQDIDQRVRVFLADGIDTLPEAAYANVRASLARPRGRDRAWWEASTRRSRGRTLALVAGAAAAALVVAVAAAPFLPRGSSPGSHSSAATPSGPAPHGSVERATPGPSTDTWEHRLTVGRHRAESFGVAFTFSVDTSTWWLRREFGGAQISPVQGMTGLLVSRPGRVAVVACGAAFRSVEALGAEALIDAMSSVPALVVLDRSMLHVGGLPAWYAEVRIRDDVACPAYVPLWQGVGPVRNGMAGDIIRIWGVDVNGTPLILQSQTSGAPTPAYRVDIDGVIDTFEFELGEP